MSTWLWSQDTWRSIFIAVVSGLIASFIIWFVKQLPSITLAVAKGVRTLRLPSISIHLTSILGLVATALSFIQLYRMGSQLGPTAFLHHLLVTYRQFADVLLANPLWATAHIQLSPWMIDALVVYALIGANLSRNLIRRKRWFSAALYFVAWPLYPLLSRGQTDYGFVLRSWIISVVGASAGVVIFIGLNAALVATHF